MLLYLGFDARQSIMTIPLELKYFTPPIESRDIINILPTSFFSVHTVSQGILFFYGPRTQRLGHKSERKKLSP